MTAQVDRPPKAASAWRSVYSRALRLALLLGCLAAAWGVPVLAHRFSVDAVLPLVMLVATASLLRIGRTLVDRLVVAGAVLVGAATIVGLVWSVWPWGLDPVRVAGAGFTSLVVLAAVTGRRPRLRLPVSWLDAAVAAVGAVTLAIAGVPFLRADATGRLALVLSGEDYSRHFAMYDAITHFGGYLYLHAGAREVIEPLFTVYPMGSHLVAAMLDSFVRSGAGRPDALTAFDHYLGWYVATYAFFALCLAWAVRWVGGALLRGWWALPCFAVVAGVVAFGDFVTLLVRGYPSEYAGLALFAVAFALLARPPAGGTSGEHLLVLAALWCGVSFTYYFLLPPLAVLMVCWAVQARHALREWWILAAATGAVVGPMSAIPPLLIVSSFKTPATHLLFGGPVLPVDRRALAVLSLLAVVPLAVPAVRRSVTGRAVAVGVAGLTAYAVAIAVYQHLALGSTSYYFEKALHAVLVGELVALAGWGALFASRGVVSGGVVSGEARQLRGGPGVGRTGGAVAAVATAAAVLTAFGALDVDATSVVRVRYGLPHPANGVSWGRAFTAGKLAMTAEARAVTRSLQGEPEGTRAPIILFWNCDGRGMDFYSAQFANALARRLDRPAWIPILRVPRADRGPVTGVLSSLAGRPVKIITRDPATASAVGAFGAAHPHDGVDVVLLPAR